MKLLNIIGAGRVGRTLAQRWNKLHEQNVFQMGSVLTRSAASARDAVAFIGAGLAHDSVANMPTADVWLIATPDDAIASTSAALAASGCLRAGDIVFHCSGALASSELNAVRACGALVASAHPLKSFAAPDDAAQTFAGTYCAMEGDAAALNILKPAFAAIGAQVVNIDAQHKVLYHAASVIVCNNLTALMEASLQCYERAGLTRDTATRMMEPLVRETVDNIFKLGPAKALTGPVSRGDVAVVKRQLQALQAFDPRLAEVYRALGVLAAQLAREHNNSHGHSEIDALFQSSVRQ